MKTILLDGLWGSARRLGLMKSRLIAAGVPDVEIHRYRAHGFACLEEEGRELAGYVESLPEGANLVGYSMGGLVIQSALLANPGLSVHRAAFINTPHRGSILAHLLPGAAIRQMRPQCEFLTRIAEIDWKIPVLAIWTPGDLMVLPSSSARHARATVTSMCRVPAHVWPLFSRKTHAQLAEFLLQ